MFWSADSPPSQPVRPSDKQLSRTVMERIDIDVDPAHLFRYISQLDPRKPEKVIIIKSSIIDTNRKLRRGWRTFQFALS